MNSAEVREKESPKERKIGQRRRSESKGYSRAGQLRGKERQSMRAVGHDHQRNMTDQGETDQSAEQKTSHYEIEREAQH